ncbi:5'-methylthioadenosine/adenosylhomocysteine nucleosidase [Streptococcus iners]|uniref:adenosylhomocysteine nucleosidase n=1 Tax=Streptococcus iners TaxID=3028084 RepID=A0AA97A3C6_9STRE|nr:5'-methylthioadenosine/adenosylhomocysteine nucleosidase [Streptococcus sp. 29887]MCK4025977.1 5'-methylthioadenosine/adenosylhomocysteine nucleosidase [Streptococcus suis]WNY51707.1 5'-methylthioadenosine/adenosylhomocysteine nucleosidase [Streptococcus sp. 29887]
MKFGIIAAMPQELKILVEQLQDKVEVAVLGRIYYQGRIGQHEVVLVQSGIGKVMSAMSVAILADRFAVDAIVNTGSAGAVADGIAIGDVVVATHLAYHDVDVTAFGYAYGQMAGQELYYPADQVLLEQLTGVLAEQEITSHQGLIVTGDSFIAGQDKIASIKENFPEVLAVEMEGAAIAQAAVNTGKPFLVIRAMSDTAQGDANITFDEFIIQAGERSAQTLIAFLEQV